MPDTTPTQMKIFVSHSGTDKATCDALVKALHGAGADVWYDEHDLGAGQLLEEIQRELHGRPVFLVLLSKAAFASQWVRREATWAFNLYNREPQRLLLPVTIGEIEPSDFNTWLFLEDFKRVEAPGLHPYTLPEAIERTLRLLALTPKGETRVAVTPRASESLNDLLTQGKALQAQQKHAEALPFFERATQADPNSFSAWFNLGYTLGELKRWAEALPADERATTLDLASAISWSNTGNALRNLGRSEEALVAHERATTLDPTDAVSWYNKGVALNALKRPDRNGL
jgi:tetratricopeptide (TPR) repeat protein